MNASGCAATLQETGRHIFQTRSPTRWQRFKWSARLLLALAALMVAVIVLALRNVYAPALPQLCAETGDYKAVLLPDKAALLAESHMLAQYRGFRQSIQVAAQSRGRASDSAGQTGKMACPIRAAFYVDWDAQAFTSLRANVSQMNIVLPEWLFIDPRGDTLYNTIDARALGVIRASGIRALPMLSNYFGEDFNGATVHRILTDDAKRARLIEDLTNILQRYGFAGVNVDFEELQETSDEPLIRFMRELYQKLHPLGLLVTQDVAPLNDDYNLPTLAKWNDYLFLMSYDQHHPESGAGPICEQKWIEATVGRTIAKGIPPRQIILCMAGYGYDWPKGAKGADLTYAEALNTAQQSGAQLIFDNDSYNLRFAYNDDNGLLHDVHFTDAATNFNTMRFAAENGLSGVALWRLGSEDKRLWQFFLRDMMPAVARAFDFKTLEGVAGSNAVDYIGEGEILDVVSTPRSGHIALETDSADLLISEERYQRLPSAFVIRKWGKADRKIVLTFDDGPDAEYTPRILDILAKEHVPAAFFLLGQNAERNIPLVKRIWRDGHEIGNHSFMHPNMAEISPRRAELELNATRLLVACITGHSTLLFRPPFNADSEPETSEELEPVALSRRLSYLTVGENIDPNDWEHGVTADSIFARVIQQESLGNIILLHDAGGNREATVQALPRIIRYFRDKGYAFTTVGGLLGKSRDELMPLMPEGEGSGLVRLNYWLALGGYWAGRVLMAMLIICMVLSAIRMVAMALLALSERRRSGRQAVSSLSPAQPLVSIVVPAFNEALNAVGCVQNLLASNYPQLQVLFVDDGSTDDCGKLVSDAFAGDERVVVLEKGNGGKASALNAGIAHAAGDLIVCVDADTRLLPDAVGLLTAHFEDLRVAAVAGKVRVGNELNLLTRWQSIEYITSQNFDRLAFARVNAITVVPGAIGAFRRAALREAGGFASDTFAEDCDLSIRLLRAGYIIANEDRAQALTEAPQTLQQLQQQRSRWTFGTMQAFWKSRDALFNPAYGTLGWIALPNMLLFQFLIPLLTPLADFLMIAALFSGNAAQVLGYYTLFLMADAAVALVAFLFAREPLWKLVLIIPQRLAYRWLMLFVLLKAMRRAMKGELQHWGVLKRRGNVALANN